MSRLRCPALVSKRTTGRVSVGAHVPAGWKIRKRAIGRDAEDQPDFAYVGGEANASTHRQKIRLFATRPKKRSGWKREGACKNIAKKVYCSVTWWFVFLNAEVKAELDALAEDVRASFERIVQLVQAVGLERVHEPYIKHIEDRIWEMRLRGRDGIARALYVTATGRRVVILRVFTKKTQKTPRREIELARQRAKEVT